MPGDKGSAAEWCTHCNAGGHTLQQCEYFANYTRGIAIAMQAIAEHSNQTGRKKRKAHRGSKGARRGKARKDQSKEVRQGKSTGAADQRGQSSDKSTGSKSPVLPSTNTKNTGK
ncbi:hypothetical protein E8E15_001058 [Penicillium rubens]|nr:hypothetical protein E8E15_001058 [Penicillium rubens]